MPESKNPSLLIAIVLLTALFIAGIAWVLSDGVPWLPTN